MSQQTKRSTPRAGQAMIGLLITVAIIIAAAGFYLSAKGKNPDGSTSSKTALKRSVDLAQEVVLQSNLNQIQMSIGMYKEDNNGKIPATFDELKTSTKLPTEFWINPVDKKPLDYDPATGAMIVTPYEGMSPAIARMTANPMRGAADTAAPSTSATEAAPGMPTVPTVPNSSETAPPEETQ